MKSKSLKLLLLLPLIIFLLSGCTGISNDAIRSALYNEENCLIGCDKMEDSAWAEYDKCIEPCLDTLLQDLNKCINLPLIEQPECRLKAATRYNTCKARCRERLDERLREVRQCRRDCRAKFPLEIGYKTE